MVFAAIRADKDLKSEKHNTNLPVLPLSRSAFVLAAVGVLLVMALAFTAFVTVAA